eukprot:723959-Hanusia_phi.AAC.1
MIAAASAQSQSARSGHLMAWGRRPGGAAVRSIRICESSRANVHERLDGGGRGRGREGGGEKRE